MNRQIGRHVYKNVRNPSNLRAAESAGAGKSGPCWEHHAC
jgi:hypothetical protein